MNNRKRKKLAARRRTEHGEREGLHELLDLVLDINGLGERRQEISGNLPTAFFGFNGHTAGTYVQVYNKGWNGLDDPDFSVYSWDFQGIDNYTKALERASAELRPVSYH
ncbi:hypothetical protein K413DRAFT_1192 [Clostridium sp. ASBs410]|nr:hypothetical protein K413DRAFT_1192 [Clostridium sp. ASBs410]